MVIRALLLLRLLSIFPRLKYTYILSFDPSLGSSMEPELGCGYASRPAISEEVRTIPKVEIEVPLILLQYSYHPAWLKYETLGIPRRLRWKV